MKIVKLKGGLGNQMFQYTYAKLIERLSGETTKVDASYFHGITGDNVRQPRLFKFSLSLLTASEIEIRNICKLSHKGNPLKFDYKLKIVFEKLFNKRYYFEMKRDYVDPLTIVKHDYFDGYWQSWQYVDAIWDAVCKDFAPSYDFSKAVNDEIKKVKSQNSVFVGVRKGDYESNKKRFGSFNQHYFDQAIQYITDKIRNPVFYIFSDDIDWVIKNMDFQKWNPVFRIKSPDNDDFDELMVMANCKHAIIINSTFHWWGARLNETNDKIVIAPKKWFFDGGKIDIVPPRWIKL